jgi:PAS domain S-box-containing protein
MAKQSRKRARKASPQSSSAVIHQLPDQVGANGGILWHLEEQFRPLVESVKDYAIYMLDTDGKIVSWNQGAERIKGYKAEEIIGRHFCCFYTPEDREEGKPEKTLSNAAEKGQLETEGWRVRKDGSRFWADVVVTTLYDSKGRVLAFLKITRDLTGRLQKQRALRASQETMRHLSNQLLHAQDEERKRIGRELHDGVGQYLAILKMYLESLKSNQFSTETIKQKLSDCIQLANEAMRGIRTTSYELSPPMLEECGLDQAVPWFLEGFMERSGIITTYDISGIKRLPNDLEIAIFRVLQECLANTRRHSESPKVHVRLQQKDGTLLLEVRDWGKGIPQDILDAFNNDSPGRLGVGLRSIKERIDLLSGELKVDSNKRGTTITASVPAEKPRAKKG